MDLILWRHADAGDSLADPIADDERPLSSKGRRQAERAARWLHDQLPAPPRLVASPTRRTRETANAYADSFETDVALGPGTTVQRLLDAAGWSDTERTVIVVGHQPTLGRVASRLLTGRELPWSVRKGAVWWLRSRERDEGPGIVLVAVLPPELA